MIMTYCKVFGCLMFCLGKPKIGRYIITWGEHKPDYSSCPLIIFYYELPPLCHCTVCEAN